MAPLSKALIVSLLLLSSIGDLAAQYRSDSSGCPRPINDPKEGEGSFGRKIPITDFMWKLSSDGKRIGYAHGGALAVLELSDRSYRVLEQELLFPDNEKPTLIYHPSWSPYESDVLMFKVNSLIDTSQETSSITVHNVYKYNLTTKELERMTPPFLGKYGPYSMGWYGWRAGSMPGSDTIMISLNSKLSPDGKHFYGLYVPQTGYMERIPLPVSGSYEVLSDDGQHRFLMLTDSNTGRPAWPGTVDGIPLNFAQPIDSMRSPNVLFSPSGKYVLFDVHFNDEGPPGDSLYEQLWISNVGDPANPVHIINLQRLYCTYSFSGIHPRFLTDTTLAISMHKDEAKYSPLWEIAIDGRMIRQLTRLETANVATTASHLLDFSAFPNPSSSGFEIEYTLGRTAQVEISVFNALGQVVWTKPFGAVEDARVHRMSVGSELSPGSYFVRVATMSGDVRTLRVIKN